MTNPKSTTIIHLHQCIHIHHFKTTFMCPRSIAQVPSGCALPGYPSTAHHLYAKA